MKLAIAVFALMSVLAVGARETTKSNIHVTHLTPNEVGIVCNNGGDPTGTKTGDVLIISCGR